MHVGFRPLFSLFVCIAHILCGFLSPAGVWFFNIFLPVSRLPSFQPFLLWCFATFLFLPPISPPNYIVPLIMCVCVFYTYLDSLYNAERNCAVFADHFSLILCTTQDHIRNLFLWVLQVIVTGKKIFSFLFLSFPLCTSS